MTEKTLIADAELLNEAQSFKNEFLMRTFGVAAQTAIASPTSSISVIPPDSNIVGVGYGAKLAEGNVQQELAIRVYVRQKLSFNLLANPERVPPEINGRPTDVIPVGDITALARIPPVNCGVSVGHFAITAGTLGCLVKKSSNDGDERFILSNNHVLANENQASINDNILEPGSIDGGTIPIAQLTDFEVIKLDSQPNFIDAAIAKVLDVRDIDPAILTFGNIQQPPMPAAVFQSVRKHGRTTGHTIGVIMDLSADIRVRFGNKIAHFENQFAITGVNGLFSSGGDSGSLIVDAVTRRPVGLLFAGGGNQTFANPIEKVLSRFDITIL